MGVVKICAVGDVHGKRYFSIFQAYLRTLVGFKPDIFVFAGDMVDEGRIDYLENVVNEVRSKCPDIPIVAVFGNEEYHELEGAFMKQYPEVTWLNDSVSLVVIRDIRVGFVGTRGALEKLTFWQKRHKPELELTYKKRPLLIKNLINTVRKHADVVILVTHYAPTMVTVRGEPEKIYPYMGSREMEKVLREAKPDVVIHAHAHNAKITEAVIDSVKVYNVSLPARKGITTIEVSPRRNVLTFLSTPSKYE